MLNEYNWVDCHQYEGLGDLLKKDEAEWKEFWNQANADQIADSNSEYFKDELDSTIRSIIWGWEAGDDVMAGKAYGHFWSLLMTDPMDRPEQ